MDSLVAECGTERYLEAVHDTDHLHPSSLSRECETRERSTFRGS